MCGVPSQHVFVHKSLVDVRKIGSRSQSETHKALRDMHHVWSPDTQLEHGLLKKLPDMLNTTQFLGWPLCKTVCSHSMPDS